MPGSLFFAGTATMLLRHAGFTLLTDPNLLHRGQRAYLGYGLWSKRLTEPALRPDELPELDAVLLSHLHGDHFDRVARRTLDRALPVVTTRQAARRLRLEGFEQAVALDPWRTHVLRRADGGELRVTAVPGQHARGVLHALLPAVMGSLLEFSDGLRIYITGDTIYYDGFDDVLRRLGSLDLSVLHLGGTRILGHTVTMDAEQGLRVLRTLDTRAAVPIHYDDYGVFRSPIGEFERAVAGDLAGHRVVVSKLLRGESLPLPEPAAPAVTG